MQPIEWAELTEKKTVEEMRQLLEDWLRYARTLTEANIVAWPERLATKTTDVINRS